MAGRQTLRRPVSVRGRGLHTGCESVVTLTPAARGEGITFRRVDLPDRPVIPAHESRVVSTERRTSLGVGNATIDTVEHLLAAVAAHQVDDLLLELDGPELPAADGSARAYSDAIRASGTRDLGGEPSRCRPAVPFTLESGGARYEVRPATSLRLEVSIEWSHPLIGHQSGSFDVSPEVFHRELAGARTFGFEGEAASLRERGLIRGATLSSAIVLSQTAVVGDALRWPDEFVRHKSLDLLGDLALAGAGARIEAGIVAHRPSHTGNVALARALAGHTSTGTSMAMGIEEILKVLPHRYPMLLVDRILEVQGTERIVGIKNVTINEPFFQGHFPGHPVMPGVLIVEAMAQVGGMLVMSSMKLPENALVYFLSIDGVKFRRPVVPGDQIRFEVETVQVRGKTVKMKGVGLVDGKVAAEAEFMAQIVEQ